MVSTNRQGNQTLQLSVCPRLRLFISACLLTLSLLAACQATSPPEPLVIAPKELPLSGPITGLPGRLGFVSMDRYWVFDPATATKEQVTSLGAGAFASGPAISPDGRLVALSVYRPAQTRNDPGGTDLYLMTADGEAPRVLLAHEEPGEALSEPAWAPDGQTLYFTWRSWDGVTRVERVRLDGSGRTVVVEGATSPSLSADGRLLAYLAPDERGGRALWVRPVEGGPPRRVLGAPEFGDLAAPRFAPSGEQLVVSAVPGEFPGSAAPAAPLLGSGVAYAHGIPWDLWLVEADGASPRQLTHLQEDSPVATWSPDGRWIAFSGELGLYVVDLERAETRRLSADSAAGGLIWVP